MTKRAPRNGPRVEVVRHDLRPLIRGLVRNIHDQGELNTRRLAEQDALWKYDTPECVWYRAERIREDPPRWKAEVLTGLPERVHELRVYADTESGLLPELRYQFAHAVFAQKLVRDWDEGRARAAKVKLLCGEVVR